MASVLSISARIEPGKQPTVSLTCEGMTRTERALCLGAIAADISRLIPPCSLGRDVGEFRNLVHSVELRMRLDGNLGLRPAPQTHFDEQVGGNPRTAPTGRKSEAQGASPGKTTLTSAKPCKGGRTKTKEPRP